MCIESPNKVPGTLLSCDGAIQEGLDLSLKILERMVRLLYIFSDYFSLSLNLNFKKVNWRRQKV